MANDKTEKATPKKNEEARNKGQVAKSPDVNGAVVLSASIIALAAFGPGMFRRMEEATIGILAFVKRPDIVDRAGIAELFMTDGVARDHGRRPDRRRRAPSPAWSRASARSASSRPPRR